MGSPRTQQRGRSARLGDHDTPANTATPRSPCTDTTTNSEGEASALDSLSYIDHHTGYHAQAIDHYQQAATLYRDLGDTYHAATAGLSN